MKPEHLTTRALGEPLPPAEIEALERTLQTDPQARAELDATRHFAAFLHQHLAADQPETALTQEQKQRLLHSHGASSSLTRNEGGRVRRPSALRWLQRAMLPLSAAALIVISLQQWRHENLKDGREPVAIASKADAENKVAPPSVIPSNERDRAFPAEADDHAGQGIEFLERYKEKEMTNLLQSEAPRTLGDDSLAIHPHAGSAPNPQAPAATQNASAGGIALAASNTHTSGMSMPAAAGPTSSAHTPYPPATAAPIPMTPATPAFVSDGTDVFLAENFTSKESERRRQAITHDSDRDKTAVVPAVDEAHLRAFAAHSAPANESYTLIQENPFTAVVREPLSTFSIDVDTAAYANVRRFLNRNSLPPRDAVRIEELINYFPYNFEGPPPDSPHPFAVHVEVAGCPWAPQHRLVRIGIQGKRDSLEQRHSNLVFLIDVSGSMNSPERLPLVKESLRLLVEQLDENDRVTLVTYAGSSGLVLPPTPGDQKQRILAAIDSMTPGGSTHGSAGIQLAYEQAIAAFIPEGVNRVILCTDGDFNVGVSSPEELENLITAKARSGVFLSVLGYGTGNLKDRTMETLADKGNGNYGYVDSLSEARKLLVDQMAGTLITIAKDVKIQVEFNPAQVASYRLIGYENRLLAKEDFNDDAKDAGEIGAGHSVTSLYEIVPVGVNPAPGPVDPLKYQPAPTAAAAPIITEPASDELLTVKLRYKTPDGETSQLIEVPVTDDKTPLARASAEFKFTAAVAAYGLMLRQSSHRGALTWDSIRRLAMEGKGADPHGYRAEFIQLLDKARGLMPDQH